MFPCVFVVVEIAFVFLSIHIMSTFPKRVTFFHFALFSKPKKMLSFLFVLFCISKSNQAYCRFQFFIMVSPA